MAITNQLKILLLDLFFPISCISCKKEGAFLCDACNTNIPRYNDQIGMISPQGQNNVLSLLDGLHAVCPYEKNSPFAHLIHEFKYRFAFEVRESLRKLIRPFLRQYRAYFAGATLVPVPLHPKRLRWRGFNQSALIARIIADELNMPTLQLLTRTKHTEPQAELNREKRLTNLRDAFSVINNNQPLPEIIILIDDITTTGATLSECAKILKAHGIQTVKGFVLGKGQ